MEDANRYLIVVRYAKGKIGTTTNSMIVSREAKSEEEEEEEKIENMNCAQYINVRVE